MPPGMPAKREPGRTFRTVFSTVLAGICLAGIVAHIQLGNSAENATGALALLNQIYSLTLALALSVVLLSVGHAVFRRLRLDTASAAEEISFCFFLGTGAVGLTVLLLGIIGVLRFWPMALLLVFLIAVTVRDSRELYSIVRRSITAATDNREARVLTAVFLSLTLLLILRAATPPHTADELIYHLPVPRQFVQQKRIFPSYDNSLGNVPFLIHMIYALCLVFGSDIAAKLFSLFLAITTSLALYAFCARFLTRRVGVIAMFAFFAAGMVVEVAITTRIDVSLAGMLFMCTYSMMNYFKSEQQNWLWLSAVFAGLSLGIKHSAGLWLLAVGAMYFIQRLLLTREHLSSFLQRGVGFIFIAVVIASPWYIKNYVWFGNPIYPFVTGELAQTGPTGIRYFNLDDESKLDLHFSSVRERNPELVKMLETELTQAINSRPERHPLRVWEFFTQPNTYLMAEPYHYPNYLFLFAPFLAFCRRNRWVIWLAVLSVIYVLSVVTTSWIARYLLPAYPPLTIVSAYVLSSASDRLRHRTSVAGKLPIYAVSAALSIVVLAGALSMRYFNSFSFLAGTISEHGFRSSLSYYRPIDFINKQLPADARVMIIGAQMNYGIQRDYLTDESWFATKWRRLLVRNSSLEEVNRDIKQQGFTHILYSPGIFKYAAMLGVEGTGGMNLIAEGETNVSDEAGRLGPDYQLLRNWATFSEYQSTFLETVYSDENGYYVYKIK
jgi:4-amino-4-deoxy-L-arabinose transferase-like glycosyltransferase